MSVLTIPGMVVFRLKGDNVLTEHLLKRLNKRGNLHCVPASLKGKYVIRFTVTSTRTTSEDIVKDWGEIKEVATDVMEELKVKIDRVTLKGKWNSRYSSTRFQNRNKNTEILFYYNFRNPPKERSLWLQLAPVQLPNVAESRERQLCGDLRWRRVPC